MSDRLEPTQDPRVNDDGFKKRYAAETLRNADTYDVARKVLGAVSNYDIEVSVHARNVWENDIVVIHERKRLLNDYGEASELPTKETVMKEILEIGRKGVFTVSDRLNAYKLYSELMGYTGRNSGLQPSVGIYANKVMLVKDQGTDEEWEAKTRKQQSDLIQSARDDAARARTTH